jgi:hypothetical protein
LFVEIENDVFTNKTRNTLETKRSQSGFSKVSMLIV